MKTSNKLTIALLTFVTLGFIFFLIFLKSNLVPVDNAEYDKMIESRNIELIDSLKYNDLVLDDQMRYILDPTHRRVFLSGDSSAISHITVDTSFSRRGQFRLSRSITKNELRKRNNTVYVHIGLLDQSDLSITLYDGCHVQTISELNLKSMYLEAADRTTAEISGSYDTLQINQVDNSKLILNGEADFLDLKVNHDAELQAKRMTVKSAQINMHGHSAAVIARTDTLVGSLHNDANLKIRSEIIMNSLQRNGQSTLEIN